MRQKDVVGELEPVSDVKPIPRHGRAARYGSNTQRGHGRGLAGKFCSCA
ncbi:hypothetical protein LRS73_26975 [Methylobacterium currus]|nr:hypothetical protein [Methylobacterium currus]UHC16080.1 hypothetical protein LRS73_26975 [Methylobacterium currus]